MPETGYKIANTISKHLHLITHLYVMTTVARRNDEVCVLSNPVVISVKSPSCHVIVTTGRTRNSTLTICIINSQRWLVHKSFLWPVASTDVRCVRPPIVEIRLASRETTRNTGILLFMGKRVAPRRVTVRQIFNRGGAFVSVWLVCLACICGGRRGKETGRSIWSNPPPGTQNSPLNCVLIFLVSKDLNWIHLLPFLQ